MKQVDGPIRRILHSNCPTCKDCHICRCTCNPDQKRLALPTEQQCAPRPQRRTTQFKRDYNTL